MPVSSLSGSLSSPRVDVAIDMGNPLLNLTLDAFLKIGAVGATKSIAEDAYHAVNKGHTLENGLKKMCKEGVYWGTVAGVYVGSEYGIQRIRGTRDWKNAMVAGALTGALVSATTKKGTDKIVLDAITGGAIATASELLNYHFHF